MIFLLHLSSGWNPIQWKQMRPKQARPLPSRSVPFGLHLPTDGDQTRAA
jgi:hypothetical protein